jgi:hypothetical protein
MNHRGFILPVVLLLLVAVSGLATVALIVARNEVALESGDFRYLGGRVQWAGTLDRVLGEAWRVDGSPIAEVQDGDGPGTLSLPGGFVMISAGGGPGPSYHSLAWVLDPDRVVGSLPWAGEVGWGILGPGVESGDGECAPEPGDALIRVRPPDPGTPPDPALEPPPRVGPVGVGTLSSRARTLVVTGESLQSPEESGAYGLPSGSRIRSGEGAGLLLVAGDLTLAGSARWRGLLMVQGELTLEEEARVDGVALVGERLRILDGARLVGCRPRALEALGDPALRRPFPVAGARLLGRF